MVWYTSRRNFRTVKSRRGLRKKLSRGQTCAPCGTSRGAGSHASAHAMRGRHAQPPNACLRPARACSPMHPASAVVPMPRNAEGIGRTGKKHKRVADHDLSRQPKSQEGISGPLFTCCRTRSTRSTRRHPSRAATSVRSTRTRMSTRMLMTQDRRGIRDIPPVHLCRVQARCSPPAPSPSSPALRSDRAVDGPAVVLEQVRSRRPDRLPRRCAYPRDRRDELSCQRALAHTVQPRPRRTLTSPAYAS